VTQTQPFDYNHVQGAFDKPFGSPPQPQVLWIRPISPTTVRVVFKTPLAANYSYQRMLCGGYYPTAQAFGTINHDVGWADFPMPSSPTSVCAQLRVVNGPGSIGIHLGRLATAYGDVDGGWTTIYSMSSQEAYMENNSSSQSIPYTSIGIDVSPYTSYPRCTQSAAIAANANRYCNIESYGAGTYFWYSQDNVNWNVMNVP
jgi:hypothetical protein